MPVDKEKDKTLSTMLVCTFIHVYVEAKYVISRLINRLLTKLFFGRPCIYIENVTGTQFKTIHSSKRKHSLDE